MITIVCRNCGTTYQADEAHAGRAIRCRTCGEIVPIQTAPMLSTPGTGRSPAQTQRSRGIESPQVGTRSMRARGRFATASVVTALLFFMGWALTKLDNTTPAPSAVEQTSPFRAPAPQEGQRPRTLAPTARAEQDCPPELISRPRSGGELGGNLRGGLGRVRVINGTSHDAVVNLIEVPGNVPRRAIYVRAGESGLITQLPPGTFRLQFQTGVSWRTDRRFCEVLGTSQFDDSFDFEERDTGDGTDYSIWKVTLNPVRNGTAMTHGIPASAFVLPPVG